MKPTSKFLYLSIIAALLALALIGWRQAPSAPAQAAPTPAAGTCDSTRTVHANGAAVVYVMPDRALLQLGVQSNAVTPDLARSENQSQVQRLTTAVRALGVDAKDIATDYYIVYPVYQDYGDLTIKGYRVDNTVSITLRDVNLADDVIIAALKNGANEVQDVQFYTSELRKYRDQARAMAVTAAQEKAQALAGAAGAQSGCVLSIDENTSSQYYGSWRGGRATAIWAQNAISNVSPSQGTLTGLGEDSPITLGQIAVRAEVDATFSIQ